MTSKILKSILTVAMVVLLASLLVITAVLYGYFSDIQSSQLREELGLAAEATEQLGKPYLESLSNESHRLTLVASDGTVLFDSQADASAMENHAGREEISEALSYGTGSSVRYSSTLTQKTIYEAVRLKDGSVLRISASRATAMSLMLGMVWPLALVLLLAALLSLYLAERMAKTVVAPLNELDLEHPLDNDTYEELSPLLHRIYAQHLEINRQMKVLKRRQEEFEQISGSMKEALVLLDSEGKIVSINPAALKLFGADETCLGEDILTVERSQNMRSSVAEALDDGRAGFDLNINGREYRFDLSRIESGGKIRGLVILGFDVTERVNAERLRREFTANVTHELKTPLQAIMGSAELLENGIVKAEDTSRFVGHIRTEAARLLAIIDDIIRLSQMDEGGNMPREELSLRSLSQEACQMLAASAEQNNVKLEVSGDEGMICGVRSLLFEAIYNLCDNAIKYNVPGGSVKVTVSDKEDKLCLSVQDSGIGIAPEHQEKIFERFYRVDKSRSRQSGGTGLGLSIVKHAVQYHKGTVSVTSKPGEGTVFTICLKKA